MLDRKIYLGEFTKEEFLWVYISVTHYALEVLKKMLDSSPPEKDVHILRGNYHSCYALAQKLLGIYDYEFNIKGFDDDDYD